MKKMIGWIARDDRVTLDGTLGHQKYRFGITLLESFGVDPLEGVNMTSVSP